MSFDPTYGSNLIGSWLSASMYGLTSVQTYLFFNHYRGKSTSLKVLVLSLWVLDTAHAAVVCHIIYHYLISNAFNPTAFQLPVWSLPASVAINAVVVAVCQSYFMSVVYRLCKKGWIRMLLTAFIMISIILHFGWGIATVVLMALQTTLQGYVTKQSIGFLPYTITQLPVDFALAGSLCILLYKKRTGFRRTETLINTLILYAVNRCVLTSIVALVEVLAVGIAPDSFWFIAAEYVIGQLYANSLLATLNGRDSINDRASSRGATSQSTGVNSFPLEHLHLHSHPVALGLENSKAPQVETGRKSRNSVTHDSIYENDMSDRVERGAKTRDPAYFPE